MAWTLKGVEFPFNPERISSIYKYDSSGTGFRIDSICREEPGNMAYGQPPFSKPFARFDYSPQSPWEYELSMDQVKVLRQYFAENRIEPCDFWKREFPPFTGDN